MEAAARTVGQNLIVAEARSDSDIDAAFALFQQRGAGSLYVSGLMSYVASQTDAYRQVGIYAARILRGGKPGDLPVMPSSKFGFVINLKTAKALGLSIPLALQAAANEVID